MHFPVIGAEAMEYLAIRPEGVYLDATAGLGGHTREIARRLTTGFVIANDRDPESLELARAEYSRNAATASAFITAHFRRWRKRRREQGWNVWTACWRTWE